MLFALFPLSAFAQDLNVGQSDIMASTSLVDRVPVPVVWNDEIVDEDSSTPGLQATIHGIAGPGLNVKIVKSNEIDNPLAIATVGSNYAWHANLNVTGQISGGDIYAIAENSEGETSPRIRNLTRAHVAQLVVAIAGTPIDTHGARYHDVSTSHWAYRYIMTARNAGLMGGYPDGTFRPTSLITRTEIVRIIVLAEKLEMGNSIDEWFTDVPENYWAYSFIKALKADGALYGYYDGTFRPHALAAAGPIRMIGSIAGHLADGSNSDPLGGILVTAYPVKVGGLIDDSRPTMRSRTSGDGTYSIIGLSSGDYRVRFGLPYDMTGDATYDSYYYPNYGDAAPYVSEFYDNKTTWDNSDIISIGSGWNVDNINAFLEKGASISGTAIAEDNLPISGIKVDAFNLEGVWAGGALTDSEGNYSIIGLSAGQYKVHTGNRTTSGDARRFSKNGDTYVPNRSYGRYRITNDASAFIGKWSEGKPTFDSAGIIDVKSQGEVENTIFKLERAINITITSPKNDATLSGNASIDVKIKHVNRVNDLTLYVDGVQAAVSSDSIADDYSFGIDTTQYSKGQHEVTVSGYDIFGNASYDVLSVDFVKSSGGGGGSGGGNSTVTTKAPARPRNLQSSINTSAIDLAWDANKELDLAGYNVYRGIKGKNDAPVKLNPVLISDTKFRDTSVNSGINYLYYVTAVNKANQESEKSAGVESALVAVKSAIVFSDIASGSWYSGPVTDLISRGVIKGFGDGTFKPTRSITREEFAKIICLAMNWTLVNPDKPSFSDVAKDRWSYTYIEIVKAHGVISGYPNGTFAPAKNVNRAELAVILVKAKGLPLDAGKSGFADVDSNSWANKYILTAQNEGIVKGTGNLYNPNNPSSRAEAATMVYRIINQ
jgi:hypothetical protein